MFKILVITVLISLSFDSSAQRYIWDFGGKLGVSNSLGEIGGDEKTRRNFIWDTRFVQTSITASAFARRKINDLISVNAAFSWYNLRASDAVSSNAGRRGRNLSFKNNVLDLSARGEFYVYNINDVGNRGKNRLDFKSFLYAGVSGFYHNPLSRSDKFDNGNWTSLRPLKTEGQEDEYSKIVLAIPMGIGVHLTYKRHHRFGWELGTYLTFTDYLDDVSGNYPDLSSVDPLVYDAFTNKSDDLSPDQLPIGGLDNYLPGSKRGGQDKNDSFIYSALTYSYIIRGKSSGFYTQNFGSLGRNRGGKRKIRVKF